MSGYAVAARVHPDGPRFMGVQAVEARDEPPFQGDDIIPEVLAPVSGPLLGERWEAFRERWSQLTFFLLDGDSWRR